MDCRWIYNSASTIVLFPFTVQMLFHRGTYITIFLDHCYVQLKYLGFSDVRMQPISKTDFRTGNQKGSSGNTVSSYYCSTRWLCKFLLFMFFLFSETCSNHICSGKYKKRCKQLSPVIIRCLHSIFTDVSCFSLVSIFHKLKQTSIQTRQHQPTSVAIH